MQIFYCSLNSLYSSSCLAMLFITRTHIHPLICLCLNIFLHFVLSMQALASFHAIIALLQYCLQNKRRTYRKQNVGQSRKQMDAFPSFYSVQMISHCQLPLLISLIFGQ